MVKLALKLIGLGGFAFALLTFSSNDHQLDLFGGDFTEEVSSDSRSRVMDISDP